MKKKFCCDCIKFEMFKKDGTPSEMCKLKNKKCNPLDEEECLNYQFDKRIKTIFN